MAAPDEAVQRADVLDVELGGFFQHALHLRAVFAHDVGVVAARLVEVLREEVRLVGEEPAVERAEEAEGVRGEKDAVRRIVGHHDLGPVDHRGVDEVQHMAAAGEAVSLLDQDETIGKVDVEELAEHGLDLRVADDLHLRIADDQITDGIGVVGLHVRDEQIVELTSAERVFHVFKEGLIDRLVNGVEEHGLLVEQQERVIGNAVGYAVYALEAAQAAVVRADPDQVVKDFSCAVHGRSSRLFYIILNT